MRLLDSTWYEGILGAALVVAFCCLGCGGSGASQGGGDPALVGTWAGTVTGNNVTVWTFTFTSTDVDVKMGTLAAYKGTYVADPSTDPKRLTVNITESALSTYVGQASNGIYKIEGSTLTFAANQPGVATRPTDFTPTPDGVTLVFALNK